MDSFFGWFKFAMRPLENEPVILAAIAIDIARNKEWVDYVKKRPNWIVECHGWEHRTYTSIGENQVYSHLSLSCDVIGREFGRRPTTFYPPKCKTSDNVAKAATRAGLAIDNVIHRPGHWIRDNSIEKVYFHFWSSGHITDVRNIMENICHPQHAEQ